MLNCMAIGSGPRAGARVTPTAAAGNKRGPLRPTARAGIATRNRNFPRVRVRLSILPYLPGCKASRTRANPQRNPRNDALSCTDFDGARMGCEQAFVLAEIRLNAGRLFNEAVLTR